MRHAYPALLTRRKPRLFRKQSLLGGLCGLLFFLNACSDLSSSGKRSPLPEKETYRILLVSDPFSMAMDRMQDHMERELQVPFDFEIVMYNDVRTMASQNVKDQHSTYDLIAFDIVWLGEYVNKGVLHPLELSSDIPTEGLLPAALETCKKDGSLYGLPIQPHAELLWARKDVFHSMGLAFPKTTQQVLDTAKLLHQPEQGMYGIAWNAQRGQPLGQTMAHFFAAFGQPLLDDNGEVAFQTEKGLAAAQYALNLMEVSPPDILTMAWDQRTSRFASGHVAMAYGWGARSPTVEVNPSSKVRGNVLYGPSPHAAEAAPVTPLGVWSLGIPSNVENKAKSLRLLKWLYTTEEQRLLAFNGNGAPPVTELYEVVELQTRYPVLKTMSDEDLQSQLSASMRPAIPEWNLICEILGTEFHEMLLGHATPEEALERANIRCNAILKSAPSTP